MNSSHSSDPDALRSDIDDTRRRMDDTMDALGDRLRPRHLFDEFLGYFRGTDAEGGSRLGQYRDKIAQTAENAVRSVVDTVKQNPIPTLLIGAGVGWLVYESMRDKSPPAPDGHYYGHDREGDPIRYDRDTHYDRPLEYPPPRADEDAPSKFSEMDDPLSAKAAAASETAQEKLARAGEAARAKAGTLKERAGEMTARVKAGTRQACTRTRDRVVTTADQHPLEVGLVALAAGVLVGLALPTPPAVDRTIGPAADRLRDRTRQAGSEMLAKGRHVARAAMSAAKEEAKAQGLAPGNREQTAPPPSDPSGARPA